jgi:peptide/nickel transport system substrate-binding protein
VVGAARFAESKQGEIPEIGTDDTMRKITIRFVKPQGDFQSVLAMTFAAPVPLNAPAADQSTHPIPSTAHT